MDNLLSQVYTTQDLADLSQSLTILENSLYRTDGVVPVGVREDLYAAFVKAADKRAFLDGWTKILEKAETVNVTLSFSPKEAFVLDLSAWVKQKYGPQAVLQITKDESIIGGIILEKDGHVTDLSIENMFDNMNYSQQK